VSKEFAHGLNHPVNLSVICHDWANPLLFSSTTKKAYLHPSSPFKNAPFWFNTGYQNHIAFVNKNRHLFHLLFN